MAAAADARSVLTRVPLFEAFDARELDALAALTTEVSLDQGEVVCRAGEAGDQLFILASGEVEVWGGPDGSVLLNRLHAGDLVGEMALLLGGPRTATVTVARPVRLLLIDRAAFERYFLQNAKILEHLSRYIARRLASVARGECLVRKTTVAVVAEPGRHGATLVASAVTAILRRLTEDDIVLVRLGPSRAGIATVRGVLEDRPSLASVIERSSGPLAPEIEIGVTPRDGDRAGVELLERLVELLGDHFPAIVLDVAQAPGLSQAASAVADVTVEIVTRPRADGADGGGRERYEVLNLLNPGTSPVPVCDCAPFVLPVEPRVRELGHADAARWICETKRAPIARPLYRLARKILRTTVGIALGGGAAFGVAHVGVLKVLDDADVPIDMLAGTSMGSIIGAGYAAGISPDEMIDIARRIGNWRTTLSAVLDPTLSRPALLSGEKMARIFASVAGKAATMNFSELEVPYRAVAADAETGERIAIGEGPLAIAYRASAAVPLVWSPIRIGDRVLIDGSMVDPVPGGVVREMGADLCVGVNVVPPLRRGVQTVLARWYQQVTRFSPLAYFTGSHGMPSMFDIGMNTIQMLQYELGNHRAISCDVLINPDLADFTWIEFYRAAELIEHGQAAAERALPQIRRVLRDRLASRGYGVATTPSQAPTMVFRSGEAPAAQASGMGRRVP